MSGHTRHPGAAVDSNCHPTGALTRVLTAVSEKSAFLAPGAQPRQEASNSSDNQAHHYMERMKFNVPVGALYRASFPCWQSAHSAPASAHPSASCKTAECNIGGLVGGIEFEELEAVDGGAQGVTAVWPLATPARVPPSK